MFAARAASRMTAAAAALPRIDAVRVHGWYGGRAGFSRPVIEASSGSSGSRRRRDESGEDREPVAHVRQAVALRIERIDVVSVDDGAAAGRLEDGEPAIRPGTPRPPRSAKAATDPVSQAIRQSLLRERRLLDRAPTTGHPTTPRTPPSANHQVLDAAMSVKPADCAQGHQPPPRVRFRAVLAGDPAGTAPIQFVEFRDGQVTRLMPWKSASRAATMPPALATSRISRSAATGSVRCCRTWWAWTTSKLSSTKSPGS